MHQPQHGGDGEEEEEDGGVAHGMEIAGMDAVPASPPARHPQQIAEPMAKVCGCCWQFAISVA